jgi:hypothetical protein
MFSPAHDLIRAAALMRMDGCHSKRDNAND